MIAGFFKYCFAQLFSLGALAYSSVLSYQFYVDWLGTAPGAAAFGGMITILIAAFAFFSINAFTNQLAFLWLGGKLTRKGSSMMIVGFVIMCAVVAWDISVNLQGASPLAEGTTAAIQQHDAGGITTRYDKLIGTERAAIAQIHKAYTYPDGSIHFQPAPVTSNSRSKWQRDAEAVARHEASIEQYKTLMQTEAGASLSMYSRDIERHDTQVASKQLTHTSLVKWVYAIVFIIGLYCSMYAHTALDYLELNPSGDVPGTQEDKYGPRTQSTNNTMHTPAEMPSNTPAEYAAIMAHLQKLEDKMQDVKPRKIGFKDTENYSENVQNDKRVSKINGTAGYTVICKRCGTHSLKKSSRAVFCSPSCRVKYHNSNNDSQVNL